MEEIDGEKGPPEKISKIGRAESQQKFHFKQAPIIPCVYTDPDTKNEKCLVALVVYAGIKGLNVDVITKENSVEQTLIVTYDWPESMYEVKSMFKNDKDGTNIVDITHPKVLAIESALQQYRTNFEDSPIATVEIKLPVEVNCDPKTWTYNANKKTEGNTVIFTEMECLREDYIISKTEKYIKIE